MTVLLIGKGVAGVAFDPARNNIVSFNGGESTMAVSHQDSPTKYTVVATEPTAEGARVVAADSETPRLYTCTADLGPAPAATTKNPRPAILPGTFRVLKIGKQATLARASLFVNAQRRVAVGVAGHYGSTRRRLPVAEALPWWRWYAKTSRRLLLIRQGHGAPLAQRTAATAGAPTWPGLPTWFGARACPLF